MRLFSTLAIANMICLVASAQGTGGGNGPGGNSGSGSSTSGQGGPSLIPSIALKIPNESAPPGGVVQMKVLNTQPTPISSGRPHGFFDASLFDDVWGIQLFNSTGDLNGVALVKESSISVSFFSIGAMQGADYPVMTIALHVRPDAKVGSQTQFDLDSSTTFNIGAFPALVKPIAPATVSVGGTISITNVVPGGGLLPAGSIVKVEGMGFGPRTQVQLTNVPAQSVTVESANEIDIVLAQATDMTGKKIQVVNPDGSQDTYFSYLRGVNLGSSAQPLLAGAIPIFSSVLHSQAIFAPIAPASASQFTGVGMQNPGLAPVRVTASLFTAFGKQLASATISIPSGYRLMRDVAELVGQAATPGNYLVISSNSPIQLFGFLGDNATQTITPFPAAFALP